MWKTEWSTAWRKLFPRPDTLTSVYCQEAGKYPGILEINQVTNHLPYLSSFKTVKSTWTMQKKRSIKSVNKTVVITDNWTKNQCCCLRPLYPGVPRLHFQLQLPLTCPLWGSSWPCEWSPPSKSRPRLISRPLVWEWPSCGLATVVGMWGVDQQTDLSLTLLSYKTDKYF